MHHQLLSRHLPSSLAFAIAVLLVGCASRSPAPVSGTGVVPPVRPQSPGQQPDRDGPEANPPPNLHLVPNASPKLEPIRKGGPNKPYEVLGQWYEPMTQDEPLIERGLASWYGRKFHGRMTSSGELYNMYAMTAAHPTMPIPSYARVRNPKNDREVIVRINDRGPFHKGRVIDVSYTAALKLDILRGVTPVEVERITYEDIRTGAWRRPQDGLEPTGLAAASMPTATERPAPTRPAASPTAAPLASNTAGTPNLAAMVSTPVLAGATAGGQALPAVAADTLLSPAAGEPVRQAAAPNTAMPQADTATLPAAPKAASKGFWVQLGAFARLDGAEQFRQSLLKELDWMAPLLAVFRDAGLHRLQAGPFATREDARQAAERVRGAIALTPVVVERR